MSKTNSSPSNTTQLSQKIIYLTSELAKYKEIVEDYENNYHYSQLRKLKLQNKELIDDKEKMSLKLQDMYTEQKNVEENLKQQFHKKSEALNHSLILQDNKIEKLTIDNKNFQTEISRLNEKLENDKKNKEKMKLEITSLTEHLKQKNAELVISKEEHQKLLIEHSKDKEVISNLQTTNASLQFDIENLTKENEQLKEIITNIKKDKDKLDEILKTQEEQNKIVFNKLHKELFLYKKLNEELKINHNDLLEEIKSYKSKLDEAKNDYANLNEKHHLELSHSKKQFENLQIELEDVKKKYSNLKQENNTLKTSNCNLKQNVEKYQKQNEYLMVKTEILNSKNDESFSSLIKMNKELLSQIECIQNFQQQMMITVNSLNDDLGSFFSIINYSDTEKYEVSELLISLLEHQFKKTLENSLDVENDENLTFDFHELEFKLAKLTKENMSTSNSKELE